MGQQVGERASAHRATRAVRARAFVRACCMESVEGGGAYIQKGDVLCVCVNRDLTIFHVMNQLRQIIGKFFALIFFLFQKGYPLLPLWHPAYY